MQKPNRTKPLILEEEEVAFKPPQISTKISNSLPLYPIMKQILFSLILLLPLSSLAQPDTSIQLTAPLKHFPQLLFDPNLPEITQFQQFQQSLILRRDVPELKWNWECLGPNEMPEELNPGGKAIPTYAINRGNGTGRINFLLVDPLNPNRIFACSPTGGLFVSIDNGENWNVAGTDQLPVAGVASVSIDAKNNDRWFIATGDGDDTFQFSDGVWRTTDAGKNWENISGWKFNKSIPVSEVLWDYTRACKVICHPKNPDLVWVCTNKGLFATRNASAEADNVRWRKVLSPFLYDIEILPWDPNVIIVSGTELHISINAGKKWKKIELPSYPEDSVYVWPRISTEISPADPDHIYCAITTMKSWDTRELGEASLQRYNLKTGKWEFIRSLKQGMNNMIASRARAFAISPIDPNLVMVGNVHPVYRSIDGGLNFEKVKENQMHDDIHHLQFSPDGNTVWAGHDGGVSYSIDAGINWQNRCFGIGAANVFGVSVAQQQETQILFGGYDVGCNLLKGGKWYHTNFGDGFENIIHADNPDVMFVTAQTGSVRRCVDGETFDASMKTGNSSGPWHTWIVSNPSMPNTILFAADKVLRSPDMGDTWQEILNVKKLDEKWIMAYRIHLNPNFPDVAYVYAIPKGGEGRHLLLKTDNVNEEDPESVIWRELPLPRDGWLNGLTIDPDDSNKFFIVFGGFEQSGKCWRFDGTEYHDISANLGMCQAQSIIIDHRDPEERIYLGTNYGIMTRSKREKEWTILDGLPGTYIISLAINTVTNKLIVGTYGRGVWQGPLYRSKPE